MSLAAEFFRMDAASSMLPFLIWAITLPTPDPLQQPDLGGMVDGMLHIAVEVVVRARPARVESIPGVISRTEGPYQASPSKARWICSEIRTGSVDSDDCIGPFLLAATLPVGFVFGID